MKITVLLLFLFCTSFVNAQQQKVIREQHSIAIENDAHNFKLIFTNTHETNTTTKHGVLLFPKNNSFVSLLLDGFSKSTDHQMILQTNNDTIVKLEYRQLNGKKMLKIRQNHLPRNQFFTSAFFTEDEIRKLFSTISITAS